jgi:hypothetical protein
MFRAKMMDQKRSKDKTDDNIPNHEERIPAGVGYRSAGAWV